MGYIKELASSFSLGSGWVIVDVVEFMFFICFVKGLVLLSCGMEDVIVCVGICVAG